jgi:hypothetical protein
VAEFKLNAQLSSAVANVRSCGGKLDASSAQLPESPLSTAARYAEQHREICSLLREYQALIRKDTGDLDTMIAHVQEVDSSLARS